MTKKSIRYDRPRKANNTVSVRPLQRPQSLFDEIDVAYRAFWTRRGGIPHHVKISTNITHHQP